MSGNARTPTIGRIVLFCLGFDPEGALVYRPARVVGLKGGVNLIVDLEPSDADVTIGDASKGGSPVRAAVTASEVHAMRARRVDVPEFQGDVTPEVVGSFSWPLLPTPGTVQLDLKASPELEKMFDAFKSEVTRVVEGIDRDLKSLNERVSTLERFPGVQISEDIARTALRVDDLERKVANSPAPVATDPTVPHKLVTDRMQGVDCPDCEDGTPHVHGAPAPVVPQAAPVPAEVADGVQPS